MKQLAAWVPTWEEVRDQEVLKTGHEAAIELRHLVEIQKLKEARREVVARQLDEFGESEARVRAHQTQAHWWLGSAVLAVLVTVVSLWLGVGWFVDSLAERVALTGSVFALSIIGGTILLTVLAEHVREEHLRRVFACLGVVTVLCALSAAALLGIGRMAATTLVETQQHQLGESSQDLTTGAAASSALLQRAQTVARRLGQLAILWGILLAVAGDLGTLLAVHQWMRHRNVVRTVEPVLREFRSLGEELAANAHRQEEVRRRPELRYIELTLAGYRHEQKRASSAEAERARKEAEQARDAKRASLGRAIKWTVIGFVVGLSLFGIAVFACAGTPEPHAPTMVVVLDLSSSVDTNAEFARNVQAVESLIRRLPAGEARLVVFGVSEASFGRASLVTLISPRTPGRLGEYLASWQERAINEWHTVARTLAPNANGSDLFGALARAAIELAEAPPGPKHLIVLSDMRQVGHGFNFERWPAGDPARIVDQIQRKTPIPKLESVEVWMLGVHTVGINEGHWNQLRAIWSEYFRRAGARLRAFSPNRRWGGQ